MGTDATEGDEFDGGATGDGEEGGIETFGTDVVVGVTEGVALDAVVGGAAVDETSGVDTMGKAVVSAG